MKIDKIIAGIKQNIAIRQKGVHVDHVMVDRRELQFLMAHFDSIETELRVIHSRRAGQPDNTTATEYLMSSANNARRLNESVKRINSGEIKPLVMGAPNASSLRCPCSNYPLCACAGCAPLKPQQNGGFPTEHCEQVKQDQRNQRDIFQQAIAPHWATHILKHIPGEILFYSNTGDLTAFTKPRLQPLENQPAYSLSGFEFPGPVQNWEVVKPVTPDLYRMIVEQNPERRSEQRKPVTSFDWELLQALNHLQNAISATDADRAHKLIAAKNIIKGVRESE